MPLVVPGDDDRCSGRLARQNLLTVGSRYRNKGRYVAVIDAATAGGAGVATETRCTCRGSQGEAVLAGDALVREDLLEDEGLPWSGASSGLGLHALA